MVQVTKENLKKKYKNSASVTFQKFSLLSVEFPNDLFCFYEGKDAPYYFPRIKNHFGSNNHPIICGNKSSVIRVHKLTNSKVEYTKYKKAYFVDRDFDFTIKSKYTPLIYETPCYSIENLYTSEIVLKNILKNEFNLSEIDDNFKKVVSIFQKRQNEFHDATLLFNAWYACLKELVNKGDFQSTNVSLDNKLPKGFITITIDSVAKKYDLNLIKSTFKNAIKCETKNLEEKIVFFQNGNKQELFRGKYEIDFFSTFLGFLITDAIKKKKTERQFIKNGTKFRLDKSQSLTQLTSYAETPNCLIDYLKNLN
ncbi:MAG: hypothetical protein B6I24_11510 [Bacteroidetes bacterium 4572_128]|nr:MAG: hypothetical protein B6I24_11510 [Bacteroidetes bacterium 4572_128]